MRFRWALNRAAALAALTICMSTAGMAGAERPIQTGFTDPLFKHKHRDLWLRHASEAGAGFVRISAAWSVVVSHRPANPRDPADPAYDFTPIDLAVKAARRRGLQVVLTFSRAPRWAQGPNQPPGTAFGAWKPDAQAFGDFAYATALRYSGSWPNPVTPLPRARYYDAWNEPNFSAYLAPQWEGKRAKGPSHYRHMLNAAYAGIHEAVPSDRVIAGSTGPRGQDAGKGRMRPIRFMRSLFCLGKQGKRGGGCDEKPTLDILAHHPIDRSAGPHHHMPNRGDVGPADMGRVRQVLRRARRAHAFSPDRHVPLWVTEFWWESNPPDARYGFPVHRQARWLEEALYMFWRERISVAIDLQVRDGRDDHTRGSYQTGVFYLDGERKPSFRALRFPFVAHRRSARAVGIWGRSPRAGQLRIQRRDGRRWRTVKKLQVASGEVFTTHLQLGGAARLRGRVGHERSMAWNQRR
jgi:hypothetical protein